MSFFRFFSWCLFLNQEKRDKVLPASYYCLVFHSRTEPEPPEQGGEQLPLCYAPVVRRLYFLFNSYYCIITAMSLGLLPAPSGKSVLTPFFQ